MTTAIYQGQSVDVLQIDGKQAYINFNGDKMWVRLKELKPF